jgi:hypothetical protein
MWMMSAQQVHSGIYLVEAGKLQFLYHFIALP